MHMAWPATVRATHAWGVWTLRARTCREGLRAQSETGASIGEQWRVAPQCRPPQGAVTVKQCRTEASLDERFDRFDECCSTMPGAMNRKPSVHRVALYHYATKSWEDFAAKMKRGSGMSRSAKTKAYFDNLAECALAQLVYSRVARNRGKAQALHGSCVSHRVRAVVALVCNAGTYLLFKKTSSLASDSGTYLQKADPRAHLQRGSHPMGSMLQPTSQATSTSPVNRWRWQVFQASLVTRTWPALDQDYWLGRSRRQISSSATQRAHACSRKATLCLAALV
jgi:hypothetical protein